MVPNVKQDQIAHRSIRKGESIGILLSIQPFVRENVGGDAFWNTSLRLDTGIKFDDKCSRNGF